MLRAAKKGAVVGQLIAEFHYTGPTAPDPTRPGSPTKSADFVWSGPVGLVRLEFSDKLTMPSTIPSRGSISDSWYTC